MHNAHSAHDATNPASGSAAKCPFSRGMATGIASLADTLKEGTKEAHQRAERHAIQAEMVTGRVSRADYAAYLGQLLQVWTVLDQELASLAARDPRVAAMVKPYHPHAHRLEADLQHLHMQSAGQVSVPATRRFVEMIRHAAAHGPAVVGIWYVLEGSANGGRFIAKALSRSLNLPGPDGLRGFDPHGEQQRERWQTWRADLDAQSFSPTERAAIIAAADATFNAMFEMMEDLTAQRPASAASPAVESTVSSAAVHTRSASPGVTTH